MSKGRNDNSRILLGQPCHYCGAAADTADHVVPRAMGGTRGRWNLVPSCGPCNQAKDDALPTCRCDFCRAAVRTWRLGWGTPRLSGYALPSSEVEKLQLWLDRNLPGQAV